MTETATAIELNDTVLSDKLTSVMRDPEQLITFAEAGNRAYFEAHKKEGQTYENMYTEKDLDILKWNIGELQKNPEENRDKISLFYATSLKLAQNTVGVAALQEGLDASFEQFGVSQTQMLRLVVADKTSTKTKEYFGKVTHAIWFNTAVARGKQNRDITKQFGKLTDGEKEDDWIQVRAAATTLLEMVDDQK